MTWKLFASESDERFALLPIPTLYLRVKKAMGMTLLPPDDAGANRNSYLISKLATGLRCCQYRVPTYASKSYVNFATLSLDGAGENRAIYLNLRLSKSLRCCQ